MSGFSAITSNTAAIRKTGSGRFAAQEVESTGAALGTPDTWHTFGPRQKVTYSRKAAQEKDKDEGGTEYVVGTSTTAEMSYTVMQRDLATLNLPKEMNGKFARFIFELTKDTLDGKMQYLIVPICVVEDGLELDGSNMYPTHKYTVYPTPADVTVSLTGFTGSKGALTGSVTVVAGDYEALYDYTPA